jgi:hypothetical protein
MRHSLSALVIAVALGIAPSAFSQQATSELQGRVLDGQGGALPGVGIVITNEETGQFRETISNSDGSYFVSRLAPGSYRISAQLAGFKKHEQTGLRLEVGRTTTVDVQLELGTLEESVTVTGETPLVDITSKEIGGNVQGRDLVELPNVNRNLTGYLALVPGVVSNVSTSSFGGDFVNINGQDRRNASYTLDGAGNNEMNNGGFSGPQTRIPVEAIQELQMVTSQFDAEFGSTSGGVVNAVSKQGTNQFRGSAFGFFKDSSLTAPDYFVRTLDLDKPNTKEQQFGGTLGGPIVRNKAHFFLSLERVLVDSGVTINIPARPELNSAEFEQTRIWNTLARFDHQLNGNHTWAVRYLVETSPQFNQLLSNWTKAALESEEDVDWTAVGTLNSVMTSRVVNTVRVSAVREDVFFGNPAFFANDKVQDTLAPTLNYPGFVDQQSPRANRSLDRAYQFDESLAMFVPARWGTHDLKVGAQYIYGITRTQNWDDTNGRFTFSTTAPFDPADPRTYPERLTIRVPGGSDVLQKVHALGLFAQDNWRVGRRLTLNLGLRYDLEVLPMTEADNPLFGDASDYPVDANNLSPRVGFSYVMDGNDRSVLRGGYGLFFQRTPLGLLRNIITTGAFADSFVVNFPAQSADPGPAGGRLPADPMLTNGPVVNRALLAQLFAPGARNRNVGVVRFDNPDRTTPYSQQVSIGDQRQLRTNMSWSMDYIHSANRAQYLQRDLNPGVRRTTARTATIDRVDPAFVQSVFQVGNFGWMDYDALQAQFDKRFSDGYSLRVSYTLSRGYGNGNPGTSENIPTQLLDDLRLELNEGPTAQDRPHSVSVNGTMEFPWMRGVRLSGVLRAYSGSPFTLTDSTTDPDRNGQFQEPLPAGTYTGVGPAAISVEHDGGARGARGPGFAQLDMRAGYRFRLGSRTLDAFVDVLNVTNRSNFVNPEGDRRLSNFLVVTALQGNGPTRTAQLGMRLAF